MQHPASSAPGMSIRTDFDGQGTTAMLLGAGELGKEIAIELMRMGVTVVACDRYEHAPAMQVSHVCEVFDMRDAARLRQAVERYRPDVIIPELEAIDTQVLLELETGGQRVVPSAAAASITMNRETIRTLAAGELHLPTSRFCFASSLEEAGDAVRQLGCPCIMKAIMSSSGRGQSTIRSEADIAAAYQHACETGRGGSQRVIIESLVEFEREITLLTVSASDGLHFCEPIGHHQVNGDYLESWQPEHLESKVLERCKAIASSVVGRLGGWGIFGVELFICRDQQVLFSEISPRPHDTGMVTMISQDLSEFALHVRALLGMPVGKIGFFGPSASAALLAHGYGRHIEYHNLDQALAVSNNSAVRIFGKPVVEGERRMGVALARAKTVEKAVERAKIMRDRISIEVRD